MLQYYYFLCVFSLVRAGCILIIGELSHVTDTSLHWFIYRTAQLVITEYMYPRVYIIHVKLFIRFITYDWKCVVYGKRILFKYLFLYFHKVSGGH